MLVSYPGLFVPAFVTCSSNAGGGLVKLITCSGVPGCWVDVWRSGKLLEKIASEFATFANTDHGATEQSTIGSLGDISQIQKDTSQLYRNNVPLLHMSTQHTGTSVHVTSSTRPSPVLVLQPSNTGAGYEANACRNPQMNRCVSTATLKHWGWV